ncbi:hypothetical protein QYE76_020905 [Lolium multiflorum]|uniref:Uncharacterized protein n=1 Tax=Lolium multiflorum TaxID=4521 RepID=A0AAD8R9T0_LOLMU|nr:hypothetical protein QYE76_020905 [Lolium multiflorum]
MTNDEIGRLGVLVSEVDRPVQSLPRYATDIMSRGLTEEEALQRALQNSTPQPQPQPPPPTPPPPPPLTYNPWAAPPPPPAWAAPPPPPTAPVLGKGKILWVEHSIREWHGRVLLPPHRVEASSTSGCRQSQGRHGPPHSTIRTAR